MMIAVLSRDSVMDSRRRSSSSTKIMRVLSGGLVLDGLLQDALESRFCHGLKTAIIIVHQHIFRVGLVRVRGEFAKEFVKLLLSHVLQLLLVVLGVIKEVCDLVTLGLLDGNLLSLLEVVTFQATSSFSPSFGSVAWVLPPADLSGARAAPEARTAAIVRCA